MGGTTGIVVGNTNDEVLDAARDWYNHAYKRGLYPRVDQSDLPKDFDVEAHGFIFIKAAGVRIPVKIQPMESFKESFFYRFLSKEARQAKYGAIVTAHT